jgi:hypothetical protein
LTFDTIYGGKYLNRDHQSAINLVANHEKINSIEEDIIRDVSSSLMCKMHGLKSLFKDLHERLREKDQSLVEGGPQETSL